ncbi:unnamed protein product [Hydatigera taeniaeformis]|uniref:Nudix hydrolase domain-containing protein n=1 Tax=Hydatigena taeniaeformis TaxID=6205 RepID=A0A0R3WNY1_HYDTA|nr:unnamed protein product [Hydatigera taeniaeformis]
MKMWNGVGELIIRDEGDAGRRCAQETDGFDSAETTPAKWSSSPDKLDALAIGQPTFAKDEDELGALRCDWLPPSHFQCFQTCDEILREVVEEISIAGSVFPSRRVFLQSKLQKIGSNEKEGEDTVYAFGETNLQSLFERIATRGGKGFAKEEIGEGQTAEAESFKTTATESSTKALSGHGES